MPSFPARLRQRFLLLDCGGRVLTVTLLVAAVGLAIYLAGSDPPWDPSVQERFEEPGRKLRAADYAAKWGWLAAAVNLGLCCGLLASVSLWGRSRQPPPEPAANAACHSGPVRLRSLLIGLCLALVLASIFRAPRLAHSFWNDEEYAFRRFSWGEMKPARDGPELRYDEPTWTEALFTNRDGNNHVLHTLLARTSIRVCRWIGDLPREEFHEAIPRAIPFLAGLLTIAATGLAGFLCGGTRVGVTAALLLALSPWHIRYSVEARGYSVMLLLILVAILASSAALRSNRWRWWVSFGLSQAGFLLAFPGSLHVAVMLNLAVLAALVLARDGRGAGRYLVASCLGAMLTLQLMAPSVPQILAFLARESGDWHPLDASWFRDYTSHLVAGMPAFRVDPELQYGPSVALLASRFAFLPALLLVVVPALGVVGLIVMWLRQQRRARFLIVALLGGAALTCLQAVVTEGALMTWYLLYTAPLLALALAALPDAMLSRSSLAATSAAAVLVLGYAALTWAPRHAIAFHDRQPIRQTVAFISKQAPDAITAVFGVSDRQVRSYDQSARILESPEDLAAAMAAAGDQNRPLYVYYCGEPISAARRPALMAAVHDAADFERVALLKGVEELFSYRVYRLRGVAEDSQPPSSPEPGRG